MEDNESMKEKHKISDIRLIKISSIIIMMLLLLVASFGFYSSMNNAIYDLFESRYVQLIQSIFNLIVIVAILYIIKIFILKK